MEKYPKVAIIILNWNGFDDTVECLNSLKKLEYKNYKIVLVDNGSANNEGIRLKEKFFAVHLIQNKINRGFAGGNNDGINWALKNGFEYIVNLNNDCIIEKKWLTNLVKGLKISNADFGSSRIMFYPKTNLICSDGDIIFPDGSAIPENRNKTYTETAKIKTIFSACGAGSIYSSECLKSMRIKNNQFFDELHFVYYEDVDLGIRLNIKSYKGISVPEAVVYHKHSATAGKYSSLKIFHSEKNRMLIEILNYPIFLIPFGEIFSALKIFLLLVYPIFNKKSKGHRYIKNLGVFEMLCLFIKARFWIIFNFPLILQDRIERKSKGFINKKIYKFFCWNISKVVS